MRRFLVLGRVSLGQVWSPPDQFAGPPAHRQAFRSTAEAHEQTLARADATDIAVVAPGSRELKFCRALRDIALTSSAERAEAVRALQEALSSYRAYEYFVSRGRHPVNADNGPQDLVIAADINVLDRVARCRELGMSDDDMLAGRGALSFSLPPVARTCALARW